MFLRRRIIAGVVVLGVPLVLIYLLTRGGGGGSGVGTSSTTTTTGAAATTTTVAPQLTVAAATWHLSAPLSRVTVLPVNGNLAVFGGRTSANTTSKSVIQIDPATGIGQEVAQLPTPVHDAAGAVIGGSYFIFGGGSTALSAAVQEFVPTAPANKLTGSVVAQLPSRRADMVAASATGQVLVVGGFDGTKWSAGILKTSDGTAFTTVAQLLTPVRYPAAAVLNGKVFVVGGEIAPNGSDSPAVQQIDMQTYAMTAVGQLPAGLSHAVAATVNGAIYVFGGRSGGHALDGISVLDPATGQLRLVGHLPTPTSDMGIAVIGQTVYLVGGEGDSGRPVATVFIARFGGAGTP